VPGKRHAEQIEDFALEPVGRGPERREAVRPWQALLTQVVVGHTHLQAQPPRDRRASRLCEGLPKTRQVIHDLEAGRRGMIVGRGDFDQKGKLQRGVITQCLAHR